MNLSNIASATVLPATLDTLPDLYALHGTPAEAARLLDTYRGRIERGEAHLWDTLILRTSRGVEGHVTFGPMPHPYVFPYLRADAPADAITAFLLELHHRLRGTPERQILLDSARADVPDAPVEAAGWVLDDTQVIYETDLTVGALAADPHVHRVDPGSPDVQAALTELGRPDLSLREGWSLHGLFREGVVLALGAVGPSGRPDGVPEVNIDMIGVRPAVQGQGVGRRLHAHLLAGAATTYDRHLGATSADNHAMRRIFEHSGSVHTGTQRYFRQP